MSYADNPGAVFIQLGGGGITFEFSTPTTTPFLFDSIDDLDGVERFIGSAFADVLLAGSAGISMDGGAGDDTLGGGSGGHALDGGAGNDFLNGSDSADTLNGDAGDDVLNGDAGSDMLDGGAGADTLDGGTSRDTLDGGDDDDTLVWQFGGGADVIGGGAGSDTLELVLSSGSIVVELVDANTLTVDGVALTIDSIETLNIIGAAAGTDVTLIGDFGASTITSLLFDGGDGADSFDGAAVTGLATSTIDGGGGADTLTGTTIGDVIRGGTGDDTIFGSAGADLFDGGDGIDTVDYSNASGTVVFNAINGRLTDDGEGSADTLTFIEGIDGIGLSGPAIFLDDNNNSFRVGEEFAVSDPTIYGLDGNDTITTTPLGGEFTIRGGAGNDSITAGNRDDLVDGGVGDDTIVWFLHDDNDTVVGGAGTDSLQLWLQGSDALITVSGQNELIVRVDSFFDFSVGGPNYRYTIVATEIEELVINGGSGGAQVGIVGDLSAAGIAFNTVHFNGGDGEDVFDGSGMVGGVRVVADGAGGDDVLIGGDGDDIIRGGDGIDVKHGGPGIDTFVGTADHFVDEGFIGDFGDAERLIIEDYPHGAEFGESGHGFAKLMLDPDGDGSSEAEVHLEGHFSADELHRFDVARFGDDLHIVLMPEVASSQITDGGGGTSGDDAIHGSNEDDTLSGGSGEDTLDGNGGDDLVDGGSDDDVVRGEDGNDTLRAGSGNDFADGGHGDDLVLGGSRQRHAGGRRRERHARRRSRRRSDRRRLQRRPAAGPGRRRHPVG